MSEIVRRQLGLTHPVFGHVFASELHSGGCILDHARYAGLAIEGEFAIRIDQDIDGAGWFERNPRPPISAVFPVIELHNYVFRGSGPAASELIANNAIHAGVVLSPEEFVPFPMENLRESISVWINGERKGVSNGPDAAASIWAGLLTLVERLEPFGIHLQKGQLALTGSPLPLYRVGAGDRIEVRCEGLPTVRAEIA